MNHRDEQSLILECARAHPAQPATESPRLSHQMDWDYVVRQCERHAVVPLVHRQLTARFAQQVPAPVLARTGELTRKITAENLHLTAILFDVVQAFTQAGIRALPFKGPALAQQLYGDVGLRSFDDLDLLIKPEDFPAARRIVMEQGFQPMFDTTPAQRALLLRHNNHETFQRPDGITLEIHWRFATRASDFSLNYEQVWRRLRPMRLGSREIAVMAPEDLLLVLCLHGTKHAWDRLSWICDVAELLRRYGTDLDWVYLFAETERMRCERVFRLGLYLAVELLDAPVPGNLRDTLRGDRAVQSLSGYVRMNLFEPSRGGAGVLAFHLRTRAGGAAKMQLLLGSLSGINQRDLQYIRLPDSLRRLYYLLRPVRLITKNLRYLAGRGR